MQAVKTLPVARDILGDMGDSMRMQWSHDLGLTINQTIDLIKEPKVPITVDVKLVGFNGDGYVLAAQLAFLSKLSRMQQFKLPV